MSKRVHYCGIFEHVTPCGIDVWEKSIKETSNPKDPRITCKRCKAALKKQGLLED